MAIPSSPTNSSSVAPVLRACSIRTKASEKASAFGLFSDGGFLLIAVVFQMKVEVGSPVDIKFKES
jgi:hypothetical protein